MKTTPNYNLKKPDDIDFILVEDLNHNADVIDSELKKESETLKNHREDDEIHLAPEEKLRIQNLDVIFNIWEQQIGAALEKKVSKEGDTITGNLRLKGDKNFGNKLIFGDGDYVHLHEFGDDKLRITADEIYFEGDARFEDYMKSSATISTSNWSSVSGTYGKRYKLDISNLKAHQFVDITINKEHMEYAEKAEFCPTVEEHDGYVYIYAKKVPTNSIGVQYKVVV